MCEKWSSVAESLTIQYWKSYTGHPWKGKKFNSSNLQQLIDRLEEVDVPSTYVYNEHKSFIEELYLHLRCVHDCSIQYDIGILLQKC